MPWEKQFEVGQARRDAMMTFWTHGYGSTSMEDLLAAMGIQRGSFYDTFKSKRHALFAAFEEYANVRHEMLAKASRAKSPKKAIETLFRKVAEAEPESARRGCLLVNCALEFGARDPEVSEAVNRGFAEIEDFFHFHIVKGQKDGEISRSIDARDGARALLGMLVGMRVLSRSGAQPEVLRTIAQQAASLLTSSSIKK